ncbi:MAG: hypothetical protein Q9161_000738 [Pseudevernia consocians]
MAKPEDERAEWLLWLDADTIIMNLLVPWATLLPPATSFPDIHFLHDTNYPTSVDAYWSRLRDAHAALQKAETFFRHDSQVAEAPGDSTPVDDPINALGRTQTELRRVIEEEAYKPTKLSEATSKVISAVQAAKDHTVGKADNLQAGNEGAGKEYAEKERAGRE